MFFSNELNRMYENITCHIRESGSLYVPVVERFRLGLNIADGIVNRDKYGYLAWIPINLLLKQLLTWM
jgi:hypothetical protein